MPKKTIVVRKKTRPKVDVSKIETTREEVPSAEPPPPPVPEDTPPTEPQVADDVAEVEEPPSVEPAAEKPPVRPRITKRTKTVKRPPQPTPEPVYEDAVDEDRLNITQQVIDLPEDLVKGTPPEPKDRYNGLLNTIYDAVVITTFEGAILEVNARAIEKFQTDRETLCEMNVLELIAGADDHLLAVFEQNAARHKFTVLEATCVRYDGTRFPAEIVTNVFNGEERNMLCLFIRDVTRRKQAEQESQALAKELARTETGPGANLTRIKELLYALNDPLQVLLCLAELEKNGKYQGQFKRITQILDELMKLADGIGGDQEESDASSEDDLPVAMEPCDGGRVLIVDTQKVLADLLARNFTSVREGLHMDTASEGDEAIKLFAEHHHAVVVLDLMTPGMEGKQAFNRLRDECETREWELPSVVFCSSLDAEPWVRELTGEGSPHAWLRKPFEAAQLIELATPRLD